MPHVSVSMYAGRSEREKKELAERITRVLRETLGDGEDAVSVAIRDVRPSDWMETVYAPDIEGHRNELYKLPGYGPLGR